MWQRTRGRNHSFLLLSDLLQTLKLKPLGDNHLINEIKSAYICNPLTENGDGRIRNSAVSWCCFKCEIVAALIESLRCGARENVRERSPAYGKRCCWEPHDGLTKETFLCHRSMGVMSQTLRLCAVQTPPLVKRRVLLNHWWGAVMNAAREAIAHENVTECERLCRYINVVAGWLPSWLIFSRRPRWSSTFRAKQREEARDDNW